MAETKVHIPSAQTPTLPVVPATFDDAEVRATRLSVGDGPGRETVVVFRGVIFQTWRTTPAEFAAGLRRLADRVEAAHEES